MDSRYHRPASPTRRGQTLPDRSSATYYTNRPRDGYDSPTRASAGGVIPLSSTTYVSSGPLPTTRPGAALDSYSGRPRRSTLTDDIRRPASTQPPSTRSRPNVTYAPLSPSRTAARPTDRDYFITPASSGPKRAHKKVYSVDSKGARLVESRDLSDVSSGTRERPYPANRYPAGHHQLQGSRSYYATARPVVREPDDAGDHGYSYTDAEGMFRDTEPPPRQQRARRGSFDNLSRPAVARERPASVVMDPYNSRSAYTRDGRPPPSTRGFDKIQDALHRSGSLTGPNLRSSDPYYAQYYAQPTSTSSGRRESLTGSGSRPTLHQDRERDRYGNDDRDDRRARERERDKESPRQMLSYEDPEVQARGFGLRVADGEGDRYYESGKDRRGVYPAEPREPDRRGSYREEPLLKDSDGRIYAPREREPLQIEGPRRDRDYERDRERDRERDYSRDSDRRERDIKRDRERDSDKERDDRDRDRRDRDVDREKDHEKHREDRRRRDDERGANYSDREDREKRHQGSNAMPAVAAGATGLAAVGALGMEAFKNRKERDGDGNSEDQPRNRPPKQASVESFDKGREKRRDEDDSRAGAPRRSGTGDSRAPTGVPPSANETVDPDEEYRRRLAQFQQEASRNQVPQQPRARGDGADDEDSLSSEGTGEEHERRRRERRERRERRGPQQAEAGARDPNAAPPAERRQSVLGESLTAEPETVDGRYVGIPTGSANGNGENRVRIVDPPKEQREEQKPKGILRKPTAKFPEDPNPIREGVAPLKDATKKGIPPGARWTKIDRRLVNPEALEEAKERYEERLDCVIVLRVLSREEIQKFADRTKEIRDERYDRERHERRERRRAEEHPDFEAARDPDALNPGNRISRGVRRRSHEFDGAVDDSGSEIDDDYDDRPRLLEGPGSAGQGSRASFSHPDSRPAPPGMQHAVPGEPIGRRGTLSFAGAEVGSRR